MLELRDWMLAKTVITQIESHQAILHPYALLSTTIQLLDTSRCIIAGWKRESGSEIASQECVIRKAVITKDQTDPWGISLSPLKSKRPSVLDDLGALTTAADEICTDEPRVYTAFSGNKVTIGVVHPTASQYRPFGLGLLLKFMVTSPPDLHKRSLLDFVMPVLAQPLLQAIFTSPDQTKLTERELEILILLDCGKTLKSIARILSRSSHTVSYHLRNAYRKLGAHNRHEAISKARSLGILHGASGHGPAGSSGSIGGGRGAVPYRLSRNYSVCPLRWTM